MLQEEPSSSFSTEKRAAASWSKSDSFLVLAKNQLTILLQLKIWQKPQEACFICQGGFQWWDQSIVHLYVNTK